MWESCCPLESYKDQRPKTVANCRWGYCCETISPSACLWKWRGCIASKL